VKLTQVLVTHVHALTGGNMAETARRTGLDRRTVARNIDHDLLKRLPKPSK
jgi:ActR/RegA family two-component response regulator